MIIILKKTEISNLFYTVSAYRLVDELVRRWFVAEETQRYKNFAKKLSSNIQVSSSITRNSKFSFKWPRNAHIFPHLVTDSQYGLLM